MTIFPESLDPPPLGILAKASGTHSLDFQPVCIYVVKQRVRQFCICNQGSCSTYMFGMALGRAYDPGMALIQGWG